MGQIKLTNSVRKPGQATPIEEKMKWSTRELAHNVKKNIRRDYGGKDPVAAVKSELESRFGFDKMFDVTELAEFIVEHDTGVQAGIMARTQTDLNILATR